MYICNTNQIYHFASDLDQLDTVREWEGSEEKVGILQMSEVGLFVTIQTVYFFGSSDLQISLPTA